MCGPTSIAFVKGHLDRREIAGRDVLEVGALDVNGSVRPDVEALGPSSYVGVDIEMGPGVDEICNVYDLEKRFGPARFDVVICTELVEHVRDWRNALANITAVLRPGGLLYVTTRSHGFPLHGYPNDYWRYETSDMRAIFASYSDVIIEPDPGPAGVFVCARRPQGAIDFALPTVALYSMLKKRRVTTVNRWDEVSFALRDLAWRRLPWLRRPYLFLKQRS